MADDPLITVGITCYREGDWLAECWNSVLAQTDTRWEAVIVLDGGHDEKTRAVFDRLQHPKLRKFVMPVNVGPYPARNKAFKLTQTRYHFYLDGDDSLPPDSVAKVLTTFEKNPDAEYVYGDYACFGGSSDIWVHPQKVCGDDFVQGHPTPGPAAYARALWERLGGFADELARGNGDYDFLIGAFEANCTGVHCGGIFYNYRLGHAGRVSSSYLRRYHETHEIMVRRHPEFFRDKTRRQRFLAYGYRKAAYANLAAGKKGVGLRLALRAWRTGKDLEMRNLMVTQIVPRWALDLLRSIRRGAKTAA
jgi:glycosyltransferase involved in cell wall biosynthesis